jgi:DNA gyrase/topoisomerase IV subunit B
MEHYANSIWQDLQQVPDQDDFTDGQDLTPINSEPTIIIEVQIDDEKLDEQSHQFIESVETEKYVDDLSQAEQQQKLQHSTVEDSPIKTKVIYAKKRSTSDQAVRVQRDRRSHYQAGC